MSDNRVRDSVPVMVPFTGVVPGPQGPGVKKVNVSAPARLLPFCVASHVTRGSQGLTVPDGFRVRSVIVPDHVPARLIVGAEAGVVTAPDADAVPERGIGYVISPVAVSKKFWGLVEPPKSVVVPVPLPE